MLGYNDALQHDQPQSDASCVVCHDLTDAERIIWHSVMRGGYDGTEYIEDLYSQMVPICVDCADLFHDVKPAR